MKKFVALEQEIEMLELYLEIESTRFEKKFDFSTRGILARPRHARTYPAKQCLGEKTQWLSNHPMALSISYTMRNIPSKMFTSGLYVTEFQSNLESL